MVYKYLWYSLFNSQLFVKTKYIAHYQSHQHRMYAGHNCLFGFVLGFFSFFYLTLPLFCTVFLFCLSSPTCCVFTLVSNVNKHGTHRDLSSTRNQIPHSIDSARTHCSKPILMNRNMINDMFMQAHMHTHAWDAFSKHATLTALVWACPS